MADKGGRGGAEQAARFKQYDYRAVGDCDLSRWLCAVDCWHKRGSAARACGCRSKSLCLALHARSLAPMALPRHPKSR